MDTRSVAHAYLDAWTSGDQDTVRRLLADDVTVESNLSGPASRLTAHLLRADVITEVYDGGRAVLMYDCLLRKPPGAIRTVDYLDVEDGRIVRIRRVYDVDALRRLLPEFDG